MFRALCVGQAGSIQDCLFFSPPCFAAIPSCIRFLLNPLREWLIVSSTGIFLACMPSPATRVQGVSRNFPKFDGKLAVSEWLEVSEGLHWSVLIFLVTLNLFKCCGWYLVLGIVFARFLVRPF